ncbi:MAG: hypothetical protein IIB61_05175, partial [Planctomycetes bacterium]|nr:hypothetical protein [Planctomycetota bacterium]
MPTCATRHRKLDSCRLESNDFVLTVGGVGMTMLAMILVVGGTDDDNDGVVDSPDDH